MSDTSGSVGDVQSGLKLAEDALRSLQCSVITCPLKHRRMARDVEDAATLAIARMHDVSKKYIPAVYMT